MRFPRSRAFVYFRWVNTPCGEMLSTGQYPSFDDFVREKVFSAACLYFGKPHTRDGRRSAGKRDLDRKSSWLKVAFGDVVAEWRISNDDSLTKFCHWMQERLEKASTGGTR